MRPLESIPLIPSPAAEAIEGERALDFCGNAGCCEARIELGLVENWLEESITGVFDRPGIGEGEAPYRPSSIGVLDRAGGACCCCC